MGVNKILIQLGNDEYKALTPSIIADTTLIPVMTSNTTPSGTASVSDTYLHDESSYGAWKAFDGISSASSRWVGSGTGMPKWLRYDFELPKMIVKYSINAPVANQRPINWRFEGSNDGLTWDILDTQSGITTWVITEHKEFVINNSKLYSKYRLYVTAINNSTEGLSIGELKMFEIIKQSGLKSLPSKSEQNFINHGMNKSTIIDLEAKMQNKVFIEQSPTTLGSGKVFKKSIDTSKIPIKKMLIE